MDSRFIEVSREETNRSVGAPTSTAVGKSTAHGRAVQSLALRAFTARKRPTTHYALRSERRTAKGHLAHRLKSVAGISVDADMIFDFHVKRIHEYKRQSLNVLRIGRPPEDGASAAGRGR
jgi:hypothetical protein